MEAGWPARQRPFDGDIAQEKRDTRTALELNAALDEAVKHRHRAAVAKWAAENTGLGHDPVARERLDYIAAQESLKAMRAMERAVTCVDL